MEEIIREPEQPKKEIKTWQIVIAAVACAALLLSLTVVVWWSIIGVKDFDDGMNAVKNLFKATSVSTTAPTTLPTRPNAPTTPTKPVVPGPSAEEVFANRETVVATMGDVKLTNGQLQIYYWTSVYDFLKEYGSYIYYYGLDLYTPLSQQECGLLEEGTWQDFFMEDAINDWHKYQAMALEAEKAGMELPEDLQEVLDNLEAKTLEDAKEYHYDNLEEFIKDSYGPGCTFADYESYMRVYFTGYNYFNEKINEVEINDQVLSDYFDAHEEELTKAGFKKDDSKVYAVRHILIAVEGKKDSSGTEVVTETDWEICRQKAQLILDEWLAGEHTEKTFGEFANKYSDDQDGNVTDGGLYSGLDENTNFVENFKNWYLDEANQVGAYGLVKTEYGYHIMYQSSIQIKWQAECENQIIRGKSTEVLDAVTKDHPVKILEGAALIGNVSFG